MSRKYGHVTIKRIYFQEKKKQTKNKDSGKKKRFTDGLGIIIERFCIILLHIKSIALLFEALCFPV